MNGQNELKYYAITDVMQRYDDLNKKILNISKLYYSIMKNHSFQIVQIENKLNEYNRKGEVKIRFLLEKQQNIIKELIQIINHILFEKKNNKISKKIEVKLKKEINPIKSKNILTTNNNSHIFSQPHYFLDKLNKSKNKIKEKKIKLSESAKNISLNEVLINHITKSVEDKDNKNNIKPKDKIVPLNVIAPKNGSEFNGTLSILDIKTPNINNKKHIYGKYLNKENVDINKSNLYLKTSNISNKIPSFINNNNYTIDEEKNDISLNERQNSVSSVNVIENYGDLPNIFTKRKKRIKYRGGKIMLLDNNKNIIRAKSPKGILNKSDLYISINPSNSDYTLNNFNCSSVRNGVSSCKRSKKSSFNILNTSMDSKSIKKTDNDTCSGPFINNGKKKFPTRLMKVFK